MAHQPTKKPPKLLQLRLPMDLAMWLKEQADRNTRSTTGEIVARLKESREREEQGSAKKK
jgi:hypothetical protein